MAPFTLFSGSHHDNLAHLTEAHEDEAPLWMMLLHWLLAIGTQVSLCQHTHAAKPRTPHLLSPWNQFLDPGRDTL